MRTVATNTTSSTIAEDFYALARQFRQRAQELELGDLSRYCWYHTVDLGDGLVTPGVYDYRETLGAFHFPTDMQGMAVLDIGSATGFFAFEFEKRGARVVSVELPSLEHLDRFPGQTTEQVVRKILRTLPPLAPDASADQTGNYTAEELYFYLLEGPFRFCYTRLHSKVGRRYSTIYDLSAKKLGTEGFDLVFLGDVLLHTLYPLRALAAAAALCKGTLILSQVMPEAPDLHPAMLYVGGENPQEDDISWWWPNKLCFMQMLKKLGFQSVEEVGRSQGVLRPSGHPFDRTVLHAGR
ncbi:MAG: hypothetical protein A3G20_01490 [Acidobacteria bacterium RIFCSPLOWO2_12_FULL_59_11]|nr:MAG: hypothetical protein A3G20_01490 [Acidobacteria bacterium RIFCSPLOWO2_12_FULL_59_11]